MDIATVLISGVVGAVTSAITAYFTSKLKVSEEREKWSREVSQKYAEALATNPGVAAHMARQFGIALVVLKPPQSPEEKARGKFFILPNSRQVVGRASDCDIVLDVVAMSGHQAAFSADSTTVYIETLGAKNPTLVNGKVVEGHAHLRSGDEVTIGRTHFVLIMLT